ncbi:hypothetical protein BDV96DRAFT_164509 [Lophiotrema nucula]|uniref:Uncharacterized protein n=1 Tax=Lophiotrema nucula TaxID=690887 RepID=A0A6A5YXW4_9PLEO|nr:hypothetical protein BDV96DRAFT_164509 [Lophiotrema nucula]
MCRNNFPGEQVQTARASRTKESLEDLIAFYINVLGEYKEVIDEIPTTSPSRNHIASYINVLGEYKEVIDEILDNHTLKDARRLERKRVHAQYPSSVIKAQEVTPVEPQLQGVPNRNAAVLDAPFSSQLPNSLPPRKTFRRLAIQIRGACYIPTPPSTTPTVTSMRRFARLLAPARGIFAAWARLNTSRTGTESTPDCAPLFHTITTIPD